MYLLYHLEVVIFDKPKILDVSILLTPLSLNFIALSRRYCNVFESTFLASFLSNFSIRNCTNNIHNISLIYRWSNIATHKTLGRIKIVFIKTKDNLISIISTNTNLSDIEIINTYKKRWNIEQGYKDLREYFQFGKEENRIYEAIIARITLSFLAYNITSYINRINNEPQTLGNLFRDLECQLETLAISMELFLKILEQLIQSAQIVKRNKDLEQIIEILRVHTKKQLGFMCES